MLGTLAVLLATGGKVGPALAVEQLVESVVRRLAVSQLDLLGRFGTWDVGIVGIGIVGIVGSRPVDSLE